MPTEEEKWRAEFEELGPAEVRRLINVLYWREGQHNAAMQWLYERQKAETGQAKTLKRATFAVVGAILTVLITLLLISLSSGPALDYPVQLTLSSL